MVTLSNPTKKQPGITFRAILLQATIRVLFVAIIMLSANVALSVPAFRVQLQTMIDQAAVKISQSDTGSTARTVADPSRPADRVPVRRPEN